MEDLHRLVYTGQNLNSSSFVLTMRAGKAAIFAILAEVKGSYRFIPGLSAADQKAGEIGEFMMLLMEGVQQEDEKAELAKNGA